MKVILGITFFYYCKVFIECFYGVDVEWSTSNESLFGVTGMQTGYYNTYPGHGCCEEGIYESQWGQTAKSASVYSRTGTMVGGINAGVGNGFSGQKKHPHLPDMETCFWIHKYFGMFLFGWSRMRYSQVAVGMWKNE